MRLLKLFLLFFTLISLANAKSQTLQLSENAQVSVLTCGNGNELYSLFGHTAVRIFDPQTNIDIVYNYGAFDFATPNFVVRFSKGDLQYFVTSSSFEDFLYSYEYEERSVVEQTIALSASQKQQLFDKLSATLLSNDRFYTYKFIDRNCTTMVVDLLNGIVGKNILKKVDPDDSTYRDVLYPYFDNHFYEQLGTSIIFGTKVDHYAEKVFLPVELFNSVHKATIDNEPLEKSSRTWLKYDNEQVPTSWWNNIYTYLTALVLLIVFNKNGANMMFFLITGLIGTFFLFAGFYSFHGELANNYNALLFNPALLLVVLFFYTKQDLWFYKSAIFCVASIAVYLLFIIGKVYFLIVLPLVVSMTIILIRYILRFRKLRSIS